MYHTVRVVCLSDKWRFVDIPECDETSKKPDFHICFGHIVCDQIVKCEKPECEGTDNRPTIPIFFHLLLAIFKWKWEMSIFFLLCFFFFLLLLYLILVFLFLKTFFYIYFCLLIIPHQRCSSFILPWSFFNHFFFNLILYLSTVLSLSHLIHRSSSVISSLSLFYLLLLTQGLKLFIIKFCAQRFFYWNIIIKKEKL